MTVEESMDVSVSGERRETRRIPEQVDADTLPGGRGLGRG